MAKKGKFDLLMLDVLNEESRPIVMKIKWKKGEKLQRRLEKHERKTAQNELHEVG